MSQEEFFATVVQILKLNISYMLTTVVFIAFLCTVIASPDEIGTKQSLTKTFRFARNDRTVKLFMKHYTS